MVALLSLAFVSVYLTSAEAQTNSRYSSNLSPDAYNTNNRTLTGDAGAQQACAMFQQQAAAALRARMNGSGEDQGAFANVSDATLRGWVFAQGQSTLDQTINSALNASCAALSGQAVSTSMFDADQITSIIGSAAFNAGMGVLKDSGLPFTTRLEVSGSLFSRGASDWEILSVQPLWQDPTGTHHVFTQVSWNRSIGRAGYADGNTVNTGLAYRRLSDDRNILYGVNAFFDHAFENSHNRMSIGADVQTSQLGASVNRYIPLSGWRSVNADTEERASDGWDIQLQGRLPQFPAWQLNLTGFQWSSNANMQDKSTFGYDTSLQWQPINGMVIEAGGRDETGSSIQLHSNVRLVYKFGEPIEKMWERPTALRPVTDRVYDKVRRENVIRVTQRRKNTSAPVTVLQTAGANTASENGNPPVAMTNGQELQRPVTVTVSGAGGSIARLGFSDGGILTLGIGTTALIEDGLVTLISGILQYVSGSTNVTLVAPGATVTLLGTDVDLSTNGAVSTLRVRDGAAIIAGTTAGSASLNAGQAASSNAGTVGGTLAETDAAYISHTDNASENIDRVASVQSGSHVAPYPFSTPELIQTGALVGDVIKIGIGYSKNVSVTGTPQLMIRINGNDSLANYSAADSSAGQLVFAHTLTSGDAGGNSVMSRNIHLNGGTIQSGSQAAVTTMAETTLSLGGVIAVPQDDTPDAFSFTNATDTAWNAQIASNIVTINGIGPAAVAVSISGDGSPEVNINGSGWTAGPTTIENGQTLQIRLTSANAINTQRTATVTVGTEDAAWSVTTINDECLLASPTPGVTCADGSLFAGFSPDGDNKMYTTAALTTGSEPWSAAGIVTIVQTGQTSRITGRSNTAALAPGGAYEDSDSGTPGVQPHRASRGCAQLVAHGHDDWYLPAFDELTVMYNNRATLPNAGGEHWTSSELATNTARPLNMTSGTTTSFRSKSDFRAYRCVRRDG